MTLENTGWAVEENHIDGDNGAKLNSFTNGTLETVTDGSCHLEEHLATAPVHVELEDSSILTTMLWKKSALSFPASSPAHQTTDRSVPRDSG